ncbi:uncharacterized protein LOC141664968 [Apium graveolens]|uniref:uncharacterized protein LOC141664968 n=1 Tax=Apium graveolens TaxID=4045 RepID=UPI003D797937
MSLIAWNCRGLGQPRTVRFLNEITNQFKPSFIFLSETLTTKNKIKAVCREIHFAGCWVIDAEGHSGGLALLCRNEGACTVRAASKHFIDFEVENDQVGRWRYTGFYGCPERRRRYESWNIFRTLTGNSDLPWCIIGDFNDLMFTDEKRGGRDHLRWCVDGFGEVIKDCELVNLGFVGEKFTWEKSRGKYNWVQERLDRGLPTQGSNGKLADRESVNQIIEGENAELIAEVTYDEVKDAVFSMHPEKSPGQDGLNPAFFRRIGA